MNCSNKLEAKLGDLLYPLCLRCWDSCNGSHRQAVQTLLGMGYGLEARVLAALVTELPVRSMCSQYLTQNRTWETVRANIRDRLEAKGIDYATEVAPWRQAIEELYYSISGPGSIGNWTAVEIACAMVRTRSGIDQYEGKLIAAAVDLDESIEHFEVPTEEGECTQAP